jgi:hypothetical protein
VCPSIKITLEKGRFLGYILTATKIYMLISLNKSSELHLQRYCKECNAFLPELTEKISVFIEATLFINKSERE